ncbi:hypothetical protein Acsp04_24180 [Actinomadura sp. NBRC 104425]|uniref:DUF3017 domain-containing protein n=1 Tax=Actinomadura sp. NBRC 104425 TaxID=3032204 RepID=UPI0024A3F8F8|nr:DUF3017 domain-containing protein [Actinomadura sp. NBRC 104425]GLZ12183.1 hypothetical protein Acsp04_24180 [Actinomadura sp. NBRC 104425]
MSAELGRRRRRVPGAGGARAGRLSRLPYLLVLCGVAGGLVLCSMAYFRKGSMLIAAALLFGALARALLPESQLGLLAVRSRSLDCWTLVVLGELTAFAALSIPPMNKAGLAVAAAFGVLVGLAGLLRVLRYVFFERRGAHRRRTGDAEGVPVHPL